MKLPQLQWRAAWFLLAVLTVLIAAWMHRYELRSPDGAVYSIHDRWTHTLCVRMIDPEEGEPYPYGGCVDVGRWD